MLGQNIGRVGLPDMSAGGRPSLTLDFVSIPVLNEKITFTRASTARYFNSSGVLTSAAINVPRFDYNPSTLAARGFLIEEARTNLLLRSEDFANSAGPVLWVWPAGVVTGDTEVAPDGTTTADTVTSSGGAQSVYQSVTVTASTLYTFSVFVKLGTMSAANYKIAIYDNIAATFIASDIVPTQVPNTSSWTRISYTFTTPVGCTSVRVYPFRNSAPITSSTVFIWGAQLEAGAFSTSYIPTTTTALTRSADVASVNTLSPWYNQNEGSVYTESAVFDSNAQTQAVWQIVGGSDSYSLRSPQGTVARIRALVGGTFSGSATGAAISDNTYIKAAVAWQGLSGRLQSGATGEDITAATTVAATQLNIGAIAGPGSLLNGWIKRLTYYPRKLSNAELQAITA